MYAAGAGAFSSVSIANKFVSSKTFLAHTKQAIEFGCDAAAIFPGHCLLFTTAYSTHWKCLQNVFHVIFFVLNLRTKKFKRCLCTTRTPQIQQSLRNRLTFC